MSATLTVRVAGTADLLRIDALIARSYPVLLKPDYRPSVMVTALPLIARANPRLVASGTYYVVERDDQVVGAGGWTRTAPDGASRAAHVRHVATDHRQVRQGIGRALMRRVLAEAAASGARVIECQSTLTARAFYAACGFEELGPVEVALRPGIVFPAIRMIRAL